MQEGILISENMTGGFVCNAQLYVIFNLVPLTGKENIYPTCDDIINNCEDIPDPSSFP